LPDFDAVLMIENMKPVMHAPERSDTPRRNRQLLGGLRRIGGAALQGKEAYDEL
jgi:hypothetical protein